MNNNIEPNPSGLCQCGCGQFTPIASRNRKAYGWVKGKPMRYIHNHHLRGKKRPPEFGEKITKRQNGKKFSIEHRRNISQALMGRIIPKKICQKMGDSHHKINGGVKNRKIALYDTYATRLDFADEIRRHPNEPEILQAKCSNCNQWFTPQISAIRHRIEALQGTTGGENRLYCSPACKIACPVFRRKIYPKYFVHTKESKQTQLELRELVLERDNHICIKCGATTKLHCHHLEGTKQNPIESADIDLCITLCKNCHKKVHEIKGCRPVDMRCEL